MRFKVWLSMCVWVLLSTAQPSFGRLWTDETSGRTIQADYISSDQTTVTLLYNGRRVPIELSRLSVEDQAFIAEKRAGQSARPVDASKGPYAQLLKGEFVHAKRPLADDGLPFWLFADRKLTSGTEKYPLVIALHGRRNKAKPDEVFKVQPIATAWANSGNQRTNPCFVVQPYYPPQGGWEKLPEKLDATIDHLTKHLPIDTKRIYLMGFSNGGQGTFQALARHPDKFAAAITVAGPVGIASVVGKIKTPIRAWVGEKDDKSKRDRTVALAKALKEDGVDIEWVVVKGMGHSCHQVPLKNPKVHKWLFSQTASK